MGPQSEDHRYRERIEAAEDWATGVYTKSLARARASFHIPPHRSTRYTELVPFFLAHLAWPDHATVEAALGHVLEAIEADVYGLPRDPAPADPALAELVREGLRVID